MERRTFLAACGLSAAGFILPPSLAQANAVRKPPVAKSARWFLAALRDEGVPVVEVGDWSHHNRNHKGPWKKPQGIVIHHTASKGLKASVDVCRRGRSDLPGPLCHGVIAKSGIVYLVGFGRTNHAGLGDARVLKALQADKKPPKPVRWDTDGNRYFWGFECINAGTGRDPWPPEQVESIVRVSAALCRVHQWGSNRVIGHKEWQRGKIDPKGFSMTTLRSRIHQRLTPREGTPVDPTTLNRP